MAREVTYSVEWWDPITGSWFESADDPRSWAEATIAANALRADDDASVRVLECRTVTYGPKGRN